LGSKRAKVRASVRPSVASSVEDNAAGDAAPGEVSRETGPPLRSASRETVAAKAREVLEVLMAALVDSPRIEELPAAGDSDLVRFTLNGDGSGLLIGRRGQTLDALEYLVGRIVSRDEWQHGVRIALDAEGYRQRHQESLEDMARRLADKARATGRPVVLNPMSPRDRRVIHLTVEQEAGVSTCSEGEGLYRRVVITPQGSRPARDRSRPR
jgi:spoIIIJ-associated protein